MLQSLPPEAALPPLAAGAPLPSSCPDSEAAQVSTLGDGCTQTANSCPPTAVSTGYFCESRALSSALGGHRTPGAGWAGQSPLGAGRLLVQDSAAPGFAQGMKSHPR